MKIACISDTHNDGLALSGFPEADVLVHAGDATTRGTVEQVKFFAKELSKHLKDSRYHAGYQAIIFSPGNHDWLFEKEEQLARQIMTDHGIITLINEEFTYNGVKFWGSPVTPPFCNWAFNWKNDKRLHLWESIPEDVDVVITHGPPKFILDEVVRYGLEDGIEHTGCPYLRQRLMKIKPQLHVFGHIHEGFGKCVKDGITYINAALMNESYRPNNYVQVEEITPYLKKGNI